MAGDACAPGDELRCGVLQHRQCFVDCCTALVRSLRRRQQRKQKPQKAQKGPRLLCLLCLLWLLLHLLTHFKTSRIAAETASGFSLGRKWPAPAMTRRAISIGNCTRSLGFSAAGRAIPSSAP